MASLDLNDPIAVLLAAVDAFDTAGLRHAAYGGLALAAYGEPRETRDADLAVAHVGVDAAANALRAVGLVVSVTFTGVRFGGNLVSRVTLVGGGELNTVDLVQPRSARYAHAVLDRAIHGELRGRRVAVVSPEDFILMKVLSTRDRDLEDARSVATALAAHLQGSMLDDEAGRLAAEIADHDVRGRFLAVTGRPISG